MPSVIMKLRGGRILIAAIAAEVLSIFALVVLVIIFGPSDTAAAQTYAERLGFWVGPISGFLLCVGGGYWAGQGLTSRSVENGFAVGVVSALLDVTTVLVLGAQFQPIFVISNAGRVIAGTLGGWLAWRQSVVL